MITRKRANENARFIVNQKIGEEHLTIEGLRDQLSRGDHSVVKKILYFSSTLRGTSQYWAQRARKLRALIQYQIHNGKGLPSFFTTGSCAEYHSKPLHRLLKMYVEDATGTVPDLSDRAVLFKVLQENTHLVWEIF